MAARAAAAEFFAAWAAAAPQGSCRHSTRAGISGSTPMASLPGLRPPAAVIRQPHRGGAGATYGQRGFYGLDGRDMEMARMGDTPDGCTGTGLRYSRAMGRSGGCSIALVRGGSVSAKTRRSRDRSKQPGTGHVRRRAPLQPSGIEGFAPGSAFRSRTSRSKARL